MNTSSTFALEILIVEDNFAFALQLQRLLDKLGYKCRGIIDNAEKALIEINQKAPDAILMDIDLKGEMTGLDLAENIQNKKIPILFITSYKDSDTYERAKELSMVGFLVKPMNEITIMTGLDLCLSNINATQEDKNLQILNDSILIKKGKLFHKVKVNDIRHIESDREYITFVTSEGKFVVKGSLKKTLEIVENHGFFRCHQRYIINLKHLISINTKDSVLIISDIGQVPMSRRYRKEIESRWINVN